VPIGLRTEKIYEVYKKANKKGGGPLYGANFGIPKKYRTEKNRTGFDFPSSIGSVSYSIRGDSGNGPILKNVPEEMKTPELCLEVIDDFTNWKTRRKSVKRKLFPLNTEAACRAAIEAWPDVLDYISAEFKTPELCQFAVKKDGKAIKFVPEKFLTEDFCKEAVKKNADAIKEIPEQFSTAELWRTAISKSVYLLQDIPPSLATEEFYHLVVSNNGIALALVPDEFKTKELFFTAVKQNGKALNYVDVNKLSSEEYTEICRLSFERN
jgi:hypothetical protein